MAFMISQRNGRFGMRAFCDCCGREVVDGECNVLSKKLMEHGENAEIFIACKVGCTNAIDPNKKLGFLELGQSVFYLVNNAKIDLAREKNMAEFRI